MKLTESRIKQIILEEIQALGEEEQNQDVNKQPEQNQDVNKQPEQKLQSDVSNMLKLVDKIDNVKEYSELLTALMKHDIGNDQQKAVILKQLRDMINQLIK